MDFLQSTLRFTVPLLIVALAETLGERSGIINIGMEGFMLFGAFAGFVATSISGSPFMGILFAMLIGAIIGLTFAYFVITLQANQIVAGTTINLLALGMTSFLYRKMFTDLGLSTIVETFQDIPIPILNKIPIIGPAIFEQNILVYFALLLVPVFWIIYEKSSIGISIIATGEHPKAADSLGVNVFKVRYATVIISGILAGVGGAFLSIAHSNTFIENMVAGKGFIALAVVILGKWSPVGVLWGSLLFGAANVLTLMIQGSDNSISYDLVLMIPYILTVVAVISIAKKKVGSPSAMGTPYVKS